jgi:hypothetical protein
LRQVGGGQSGAGAPCSRFCGVAPLNVVSLLHRLTHGSVSGAVRHPWPSRWTAQPEPFWQL